MHSLALSARPEALATSGRMPSKLSAAAPLRSTDTAKLRLAHASNMHSQILSGPSVGVGLKARPSLQRTGVCMSPENLAVLKSLAIRPSQSIVPSIQPIVIGLQQAGYVTNGPSGWIATAKGCEALERQRAVE